mmetsp:Transcript_35519/g.77553  ORF Transcript_35519/g.77553 Transcript_35519/m.77553 type:complete len:211 (-) Transcript_35519:183-815(-)
MTTVPLSPGPGMLGGKRSSSSSRYGSGPYSIGRSSRVAFWRAVVSVIASGSVSITAPWRFMVRTVASNSLTRRDNSFMRRTVSNDLVGGASSLPSSDESAAEPHSFGTTFAVCVCVGVLASEANGSANRLALPPIDSSSVTDTWDRMWRADKNITMLKSTNIEMHDHVVLDWKTLFLAIAWEPSFVPVSKSGAEGTRRRVSPTARLEVLT